MLLNGKIKFGNVAPKKSVMLMMGAILCVLFIFSVLARYHLKSSHKFKIESLENIRLRVVYAHLELEDSTLTTFKSNHIFNSDPEEKLITLLEVKWDDYLIPLLSHKERKEVKVILEKIEDFNKLIKQKASPKSKLVHDAVFNSIINEISLLNTTLNNRLKRQDNFIYVFQLILMIILVAWLVFTVITLKNIRLDRKKIFSQKEKLLIKLKHNNFFLQKAQDISNLGYYTFNLNTREWTASDFILDLVGYKKGDNILDDWEKIVHPDDEDVFTKIFYDSTETDDFSFDLTYRIIRKPDGKTRWIHHVASKLEDADNQKDIAVIGVMQDITSQYNLELTIKAIEKSIALKMGKDYYTALAKELNEKLKADYILIGKYDGEKTTTSVAHIDKLKTLPNFTYDITNTPCEIVLKEGYAFYGNNVAKYFDKDDYLKNLGISSYVGVAVYNNLNQVVGHLVALYCKPILEEEHFKLLMKIFADKIGAEFNRNKLLDNLTKNQEELIRSQELALLGTYTYDVKDDKLEMSPMLAKIAGLEQKALKKVSDWDSLVHSDDLDKAQKINEEAIKRGGSFEQEYRIISKDTKTLKWIQSSGLVIQKEGVSVKVIGTIQDITEQKLIALSLEQNHQRFKSLFDENPIALWEDDYSEVIQLLNDKKQEVADLKTYLDNNPDFVLKCAFFKSTILNVNRAVLDLFEVADKKEFSQHLKTHFSEEHFMLYKKGLLAIALNKKILTGEVNFVTKTGKTINTILKVVILGDKGMVIFTINDLTKLKTAEKTLIESQEKLNEAIAITHLGTFSFNTEMGDFKTSSIFDSIIGVKNHSLKNIEEFVKLSPPDDCQYIDKLFNDINVIKIEREFRVLRPKDNKIIWILLHANKKYDKNSILLSIEGTIQDITKRKMAEEKLKQSDAILNKLNSMVLVNDGNSNMIYVSPSVRAILGYEPEELLGQGWWDLTYESAQEAKEVQKAVANYLYHDGIKSQRVTYRKVKTKTGDFRHIEWHISKGVGKTYINIGVDITQRYREEQIKNIIFNITKEAQKQSQLASLLHFVKESLSVVIDTSNFYVALYNAEKQNFSLPYVAGEDADMQGKTFPIGKSLTGYVLRKAQTTIITDSDFEVIRKKGEVNLVGKSSKVWVGVPLIEDNETLGVLVVQSFTNKEAFSKKDIALMELVAINISQVIKQSQDLEKINLLNSALIQSPASVVITDIDGNIEYVNPTFTEFSGYTYEEAIGENPRILKSGNTSEADYKDLWKTLTSGKIWSGEFLNKRKDGSKYLVAVNISGVKNNLGIITHYIGIQEDITEKRQLERDYLNAFIEAQEEEKQSFGEELHDGISQILAAEKMYIDILFSKKEISDVKKNEFLNKIKEHNLNAITDTRRIAHGLMSKQLKEKGLLEAIKLICADYSNSKSIAISYKLKELKESEIDKIIKTHLYRIFQEITTNITRHSGATKASVSFSKTLANELKLVIEDNGAGIDFEKMKRENRGAGLKNIERRVTLLNGKLEIKSEIDNGTKFTIEVPLKL